MSTSERRSALQQASMTLASLPGDPRTKVRMPWALAETIGWTMAAESFAFLLWVRRSARTPIAGASGRRYAPWAHRW